MNQSEGIALTLSEIFNGFQCDAGAIIPAISLVLHGFIVESRGKRSKKVYILIENYPESEINDIKANMIENFIKFEAVVLKVYQIKLMALSLCF